MIFIRLAHQKLVQVLLFLLSLLSAPQLSMGQDSGKTESSEFYIERDLVSKIYEGALQKRSERTNLAGIRLSPRLGSFLPSKLKLENDYFSANYAEEMKTLPFFQMVLTKQLTRGAPIAVNGEVHFGYGFKQDVVALDSNDAAKVDDNINLQWVPIGTAVGLELERGLGWVRPFLISGVDANWFHQSGSLDGVEQGFWLASYSLGGGLLLFGGSASETGFFDGLVLQSAYSQALASGKNLKGWSHQVGTRIAF